MLNNPGWICLELFRHFASCSAEYPIFSGVRREEDTFEWTFTPKKQEIQRWLKASGKTMTVYVEKPAQREPRLAAKFALSADSGAMNGVARLCWKEEVDSKLKK